VVPRLLRRTINVRCAADTAAVPGTIFWTSITGIAVSGVIGPGATAWATRLANRTQFVRDREAAKRDDLRALFDKAAQVLGVGPIRLRQIWEQDRDAETLELVRTWPDEVYVVGQRITLRLGATSPVAIAYDTVREGLRTGAEIPPGDTERHNTALSRFEAERDAFLAAALAKLDEPIPTKEPKR
jgi:hypothetical protein